MASKEMLDWQYKSLLGELQELQRHAADPSCPCRLADLNEWCIPKHALGIATLAAETAAMDPANERMLFDLQESANKMHETARKAICHEADAPDLVKWSRDWRKRIEPLYYRCKVKLKQEPEPGVKITGKCPDGTPESCEFKVKADTKPEKVGIDGLAKAVADAMKPAPAPVDGGKVEVRPLAVELSGQRFEVSPALHRRMTEMANTTTKREKSLSFCKDDKGTLQPGVECTGGKCSVRIKYCSDYSRHGGSFHTHPSSGITEAHKKLGFTNENVQNSFSLGDLKNMKKGQLDCVSGPHTGVITCGTLTGPRPALAGARHSYAYIHPKATEAEKASIRAMKGKGFRPKGVENFSFVEFDKAGLSQAPVPASIREIGERVAKLVNPRLEYEGEWNGLYQFSWVKDDAKVTFLADSLTEKAVRAVFHERMEPYRIMGTEKSVGMKGHPPEFYAEQPEPPREPPAVSIRGTCKKNSCSYKVTATDKTEVETASTKALAEAIEKVMADASKRLEKPTGKPAPASNRTWAQGQNELARYEFEYQIVEASELVASHDPWTFELRKDYPQELQPRLRDRAATRVQVEKMAATLSPEALLSEFHALDRGTPIMGIDWIVESGNGRVMALQRSAKDHPEVFARYRDELTKAAPQFGIDPKPIKQMKAPVLVRVRLTDVNRVAFVNEANAPAALSPSAIEQARTDARHVTVQMLSTFTVDENESIEDAVRSPRNRHIAQEFLARLSPQEQARLIDARGVLNQDGVKRITMALFVSAFPGDSGLRLAEKAFESIEMEIRNVINGISRALGKIAKAEAMVRDGQRRAELSIGDDLAQAASAFASIKRTPGMTVEKYLAQGQMFEKQLTPFQKKVLQGINERSRSAKRVGNVLSAYADMVIAAPPPQQVAMIPGEEPTKERFWETALGRDANPNQIGFFQ